MKIFPGHRPWQATQSATDWGREQIFDDTEGEYKCKYKYRRWKKDDTQSQEIFSGETRLNLLQSCLLRGALAEGSGQGGHSRRGRLTPLADAKYQIV